MSTSALSQSFPYTATVTVEKYLDGVRIDRFLVRHFRNYTQHRMQRLVRAGQVWIEEAAAEIRFRVRTGQRVRVRLIEPPDKLIEAQNLPLDILYEDEHLLAVNKPPWQSTHPGGNYHEGTLANALQYYLDQHTPLPGLLRPGIVHRLDRLTSGVIVACKDHLSHRNLSLAFQQGRVSKSYLALVQGHLKDERGMIDAPLGRLPGQARMGIGPAAVDAKAAQTRYEVIQRFEQPYTLVKCMPLTGRFHQIRVHLASVGHPIVADEFYAESNGELLLQRQALHASQISFSHPVTGDPVGFAAPYPADFTCAIAQLSTAPT